MSLANTVAKLCKPTPVTRRTAAVWDGTSAFPVAPPTETTETVRLHLQRTSSGTRLSRELRGDETAGDARVWVPADALAAVGWTSLQIAPPENADGPPGDWIDWEGIRWEIQRFLGWDNSFAGSAGFLRYEAKEIGATP